MQKITKDNYSEVFNGLSADLDAVTKDVIDTTKLRNALEDKRKGAEENVKNNSVLQIGIVGQVKAGKSSFLNSLFFNGDNVLPRASTPMTAGLTVLEYGEENVFTVDYYSQTEWNTFVAKNKEYEELVSDLRQRNPDTPIEAMLGDIDEELKSAHELVEQCGAAAQGKIGRKAENQTFSGVEGLQQTLEKYVGAHGAFTPVVKSLTIRLNNEALRDLRIVDTPGVNDPVVSRENRTREFLRACHGVFFLSYSGHFFDSTDQTFLSDRIGGNGIGAVVMIASKFDTVLQQVGLDYKDDIMGAIAHCRKMLKSQFDSQLSGTTYTGNRPALTYSSGIGYSIAQKSQGEWDDVEQNVVSQMKRFFPSFFSSPDDIKAAFTELAQIEEIREKYVKGEFAANKDAIMAQKLNSFFSTATAEMAKQADKIIRDVENELESLKKTSLEDINKKKQDVKKASDALASQIDSLAERLPIKVDTAIKRVMNSASLSVPQLATSTRSGTYHRETTAWLGWWDKKFSCTFSLPDSHQTLNNVKAELAKLGKVREEWKRQVVELKEFVKETLEKSVNKAEDEERSVDGQRLICVINEVADNFDNAAELDFSDIVSTVEETCEDVLQQNNRVSYTKRSESQEDAVAKVRDSARECCERARTGIRGAFADVRNGVTKRLNSAGQVFKNVVYERKGEFIDEIKDKLEARINKLEEDLHDKEANIHANESALQSLKSFRAKL